MHKVQKSMKPWTKEKERKPNTITQSRRVLRKKSLRSKIDLSKSSKCRLFLSLQMHHIKQWGTTIQIAKFRCLPNFPFQQANSSTTIFSITQWMPNRVNNGWGDGQLIPHFFYPIQNQNNTGQPEQIWNNGKINWYDLGIST